MKNWADDFENVTWEKYVDLAFALSRKMTAENVKFDLIVTIARGGLTLSQLLSDSLKLPIAAFTIQSYKDLKQIKQPQVTYGLKGELKNKMILLLDDVCDTGKTFLRGLAYLEELGVKRENIMTASLHLKPHAKFQPDFYVQKVKKWIIYPYEIRETISALTKVWQKHNISKKEIINRFLMLQFPKEQVEKYL